jgi:uncharacterized protein YbbC (DUF1343 family)
MNLKQELPMRKTLALLLLAALSTGLAGPKVQTGIEVLRQRGFDILKGKRVGLITNPTGVDASLRSTVDILADAPGVKLAALFGPEHGVRGEFAAGDVVGTTTDPKTGVPAYSLYGRNRKPTADMLKQIDILVYDIQDIGCRSYTFISTMGLAMEAAAEAGIPFVVLDRPNPLGGRRVEGNVAEAGFFSFIGQFPIPYVYGLTCGELAKLLNGEKMLSGGRQCSLIVVPMKGWRRTMTFQQTGLPWVPTSPHVPAETSPAFYVATGVLGELGVISEGVGYTIPFRVLAAPWINPYAMADAMNALKLPGTLFRPIIFKPFYGRMKDSTLFGVQIHFTDEATAELMPLQFRFLEVHNRLYPDKNPFTLAGSSRLGAFDRAAGTDRIRALFSTSMKYSDIQEYLSKDVKTFREISGKYTLYR